MPPDAAAVRLGQRLRKARLARNLTQSEVAQQRFSVSYISAVERGQIRPSLGALEKLSERLRVPLSDLLRDDGDIDIPHTAPVERSAATEERDEMDARLLYARILARQGQSRFPVPTVPLAPRPAHGPRYKPQSFADLSSNASDNSDPERHSCHNQKS